MLIDESGHPIHPDTIRLGMNKTCGFFRCKSLGAKEWYNYIGLLFLSVEKEKKKRLPWLWIHERPRQGQQQRRLSLRYPTSSYWFSYAAHSSIIMIFSTPKGPPFHSDDVTREICKAPRAPAQALCLCLHWNLLDNTEDLTTFSSHWLISLILSPLQHLRLWRPGGIYQRQLHRASRVDSLLFSSYFSVLFFKK